LHPNTEDFSLRAPAVSGFAATLLAVVVLSIVPAMADPSGIWLTEKGDARIHVSRCGGGICGRIVWLREPIDPKTGKAQVDDKNPNPALHQRPIIGLSIFSSMQSSGANRWSGRIYNADDGQTYRSKIVLRNAAQLEVQGCAGPLCGSEQWRRVGR
jgi:uncharacterized protein (DUF2147 family)